MNDMRVSAGRQIILGCVIDNLSMPETLDRISEFVASGRPHRHVVVNVDKVVKASRDARLRELINSCDLINADGMPIVWASWLLRKRLKARVAGIDLFMRLIDLAERNQWRVYFLGAREAVVDQVVREMERRHPALLTAGWRNGYWQESEEPAVVEAIRAARPQLLFVAISSPKKEEFLEEHAQSMGVPFVMGVGGSFDVVAGLTKRAPKWMQDTGFEWFYRFLQEPRRMFRRYFIEDMYFFWLLVKELVHR